MKTYNNLYKKLCTKDSLEQAYLKAKKGKSKKQSVIDFDKDKENNLRVLQDELITLNYEPKPLKRFIVRDPKTRTIHASAFRDRIVHHLIVNSLRLIFEKRFIFDSYASIKDKGAHKAVERFDKFKRKVSRNGKLVRNSKNKNQIKGYVLKADISHYFDNVDHETLLNIIKIKVKDGKIIWLIRKVLNNFISETKGKGMPLGNYTSQFFANVYLNKLDYFIKHELKAKYYIRYVDDFVILHRSKKRLEHFKERIIESLQKIKLQLHPEKSDIIPLQKGVNFLGYRVFYKYKLLRKRNRSHFLHKFEKHLEMYEERVISDEQLISRLEGWFGYAKWANTYYFRKNILKKVAEQFKSRNSNKINELYKILDEKVAIKF